MRSKNSSLFTLVVDTTKVQILSQLKENRNLKSTCNSTLRARLVPFKHFKVLSGLRPSLVFKAYLFSNYMPLYSNTVESDSNGQGFIQAHQSERKLF